MLLASVSGWLTIFSSIVRFGLWLPISFIYLLYLLLLCSQKVFPVDINEVFKLLGSHKYIVHSIGILSVSYLGKKIYDYRNLVVRIAKAIKQRSRSIPYNANYWVSSYAIKVAQEKLMEFSKGSNSIDIFAGDADFIEPSNPQYKELLSFGTRVRILLNKDNKADKDCLRKLVSKGSKIRAYPFGIDNLGLRGRICYTDTGKKARFLTQDGDMAIVETITNRAATRIISDRFEKYFKLGMDPFIKCILFDTDSVFYNVDYHNFLRKLRDITGIRIGNNASFHVCFDEEMSIGECTIVEAIAKKSGKRYKQYCDEDVRKLWLKAWTINEHILKIIEHLRGLGYKIYLYGNIDRDIYRHVSDNGDLDCFDGFLTTIDIKLAKTDKRYLPALLERLSYKPFEIAIIEDQKESVALAEEMNIKTIHLSRRKKSEEKAKTLEIKLIDNRICAKRGGDHDKS